MSSEDTSPEVLEGRRTTVLGKQKSDDKDTMYTEQSEVPAHNRIMRLYENMAPEYRLYIKRHEFETLEQWRRNTKV